MSERIRVLILSTENSALSQMAEALLRHDGGSHYDVFSAGAEPSHVRAEAVIVMREIGIDISGYTSKSVDEFMGQTFDFVITLSETTATSYPNLPEGTKHIDWHVEDPAVALEADERLAAHRRGRDQLRARLRGYFTV